MNEHVPNLAAAEFLFVVELMAERGRLYASVAAIEQKIAAVEALIDLYAPPPEIPAKTSSAEREGGDSSATIQEYPRVESGTAREASGGSAPSDGIAGLREGLKAAPRTSSQTNATNGKAAEVARQHGQPETGMADADGVASRPSRAGGSPAQIQQSDGGAFAAVKVQDRLADAVGVEPSSSEPASVPDMHQGQTEVVTPSSDESVTKNAAPANLEQFKEAGVAYHFKKQTSEVHQCDCGEHCWLNLTRGYVALISPEDAAAVAEHKWQAGERGRDGRIQAKRHDGPSMQRSILGGAGRIIDHANGSQVDNRRVNIRFATDVENGRNKQKRASAYSRFKGVTIEAGKWRAQISVNGGTKFLGYFDDEKEAAAAYNAKAAAEFGEFACLNDLDHPGTFITCREAGLPPATISEESRERQTAGENPVSKPEASIPEPMKPEETAAIEHSGGVSPGKSGEAAPSASPALRKGRSTPLLDQVNAVLKEHPDWTARQIGEAVGRDQKHILACSKRFGLAIRRLSPEEVSASRKLGGLRGSAAAVEKRAGPERKPSLRQRILECHTQHPDWNAEKVANHLDALKQSVSAYGSILKIKWPSAGLRAAGDPTKFVRSDLPATKEEAASSAPTPRSTAESPPAPIPEQRAPAFEAGDPDEDYIHPSLTRYPAKPTGNKVSLKDQVSGFYLHDSVTVLADQTLMLTADADRAWRGTRQQLHAVRTKFPTSAKLVVASVPVRRKA